MTNGETRYGNPLALARRTCFHIFHETGATSHAIRAVNAICNTEGIVYRLGVQVVRFAGCGCSADCEARVWRFAHKTEGWTALISRTHREKQISGWLVGNPTFYLGWQNRLDRISCFFIALTRI